MLTTVSSMLYLRPNVPLQVCRLHVHVHVLNQVTLETAT